MDRLTNRSQELNQLEEFYQLRRKQPPLRAGALGDRRLANYKSLPEPAQRSLIGRRHERELPLSHLGD